MVIFLHHGDDCRHNQRKAEEENDAYHLHIYRKRKKKTRKYVSCVRIGIVFNERNGAVVVVGSTSKTHLLQRPQNLCWTTDKIRYQP